MPRFAANLTMLFTEVAPLERPAYAAQAGFDGVEVLFPYDVPVADWVRALGDMPLALINTPPGDWASGDRGFAAVPGAEARFRDSFLRGADYATRLGAARLHVMAGVAKGPVAEEVFLANLAWAAAQTPDLHLTLEPLNPADMPGYFLNDYDHAARMIDDLAVPTIGLQFDLWHATRLYGDAAAVWQAHKSRVSHVQIAGFPNRAEPGGGGFDLTALCNDLDVMGFPGWLSAEYVPAAGTLRGLGWLAALKGRAMLIGSE
ncbi:MAG: TIM barrel protein [Rhodobacteraceae bacterium]|jgi:2-dehydrotetronate isomerase|nr:TIM barrel protein [Paracoccaceae bacterium]